MTLCSTCTAPATWRLYNQITGERRAACDACRMASCESWVTEHALDSHPVHVARSQQRYLHELKRALGEVTAAVMTQPSCLHAVADIRAILTGLGIDLAAETVTAALLPRDDILDAWQTTAAGEREI